jgi:type II secretion system protein H
MPTLAIGDMRTRGRAGFSLIELLVVIVLMAVLTAMIVPEMRGTFEDARLRSTGRKLASAMNLAHSRAVTLQQAHRLALDAQSGRFAVERMARETEGSGFIPVSDVPGGTGELDKRITLELSKDTEGDPNTVSFYPNGTAEAAQILLRDREGFVLALKVNGITARVTAQEAKRE